MASARRRPRVTLDQLHTFIAVAERQHLSQAAEDIHLSQAAASQQVRLLERSLGVPLFERGGRRLRLTAFGRAVVAAASATLDAASVVEALADEHLGLRRGAIAVAASNIMGVHRLPRWLAGFVEAHPAIDVELRLSDYASALAALRAGTVDCAIVGGELPELGPDTLFLERDELVIVAGANHPLARSTRGFADLPAHRYLARKLGSGTEQLAPRLLGAAYRTGTVQELDQGAILAGLLAGLGYTVMPSAVVGEEVAAGRVVVIAHPGKAVPIDFYALRRAGPHSPSLVAFFDYLATVSAGPPSEERAALVGAQ